MVQAVVESILKEIDALRFENEPNLVAGRERSKFLMEVIVKPKRKLVKRRGCVGSGVR